MVQNMGSGRAIAKEADGQYTLHALVGDGVDWKVGDRVGKDRYSYFSGFDNNTKPDAQAIVRLNGRFGVINPAGVFVVPARYDWASSCREGYAEIYLGELMGLWDCAAGKEAVAPTYISIDHPYTAGRLMAAAPPGGGFGIFKLDGTVVHGAHHALMSHREFGNFVGNESGGLWWFSPAGKKLFPFDGKKQFISETAYQADADNGMEGVFDHTGAAIIPAQYEYIRCRDGTCVAEKDGVPVVSFETATLKPAPYRDDPFTKDGLRVVDKAGGQAVVDRSGRVIVDAIMDDEQCSDSCVSLQDTRFIAAFKKGGWGLVSRTGKPILPFQHRSLSNRSNGNPFSQLPFEPAVIVRSSAGPGVLSGRGAWLLPPGKYPQVSSLLERNDKEQLLVVVGDAEDKKGLFNVTLQREELRPQHRSISMNYDHYRFSTPNGRDGVHVFASAKDYLSDDMQFDEYHPLSGRLTISNEADGKKLYGFAGLSGNPIVQPRYTNVVFDDSASMVYVSERGRGGFVDTDGKPMNDGLVYDEMQDGFAAGVNGAPPPPSFLPVFDAVTRTAIVRRSGELQVIDANGRVLARGKDFSASTRELDHGSTASSVPFWKAQFDRPTGGFHQKIKVNGKVYHAAGGDIGTKEIAAHFTAESGGLMAVRENGKFGYIDVDGAMVIAPRFDHASEFRRGIALVQQDGQWLYITRSGSPTKLLQGDMAIRRNSVQSE